MSTQAIDQKPDDMDIIAYLNEMKKVMLTIAQKTDIAIIPLDIQTAMIELHRKLDYYLNDFNFTEEGGAK